MHSSHHGVSQLGWDALTPTPPSSTPRTHPYPLLPNPQDLGFDSTYKDPSTRVYMTRAAQPWHADAADLVGEDGG